nr:hypothetical protein CFP56_22140 [Quercus suber]
MKLAGIAVDRASLARPLARSCSVRWLPGNEEVLAPLGWKGSSTKIYGLTEPRPASNGESGYNSDAPDTTSATASLRAASHMHDTTPFSVSVFCTVQYATLVARSAEAHGIRHTTWRMTVGTIVSTDCCPSCQECIDVSLNMWDKAVVMDMEYISQDTTGGPALVPEHHAQDNRTTTYHGRWHRHAMNRYATDGYGISWTFGYCDRSLRLFSSCGDRT